MQTKKFVKTYMSIVFGTIILNTTMIYTFDPLQLIRKADWYYPYFSKEERFQNPGLIKNYDYDTIILGSSMVRNFSSKYIGEKLNLHPIKLSLSNSNLYEQNLTFNLANSIGTVKNVIWAFDTMFGKYFGHPGSWLPGHNPKQPDFPDYLYAGDMTEYHKYFLNLGLTYQFLKHLVQTYLLRPSKETVEEALDNLNNFHKKVKIGKSHTLKKYDKALEFNKKNPIVFTEQTDFERLKKQIDEFFIATIKTHPNIKFIIFFPPYSILLQKYYEKFNLFDFEIKIKKYVIDALIHEPNVEIYDFQDDSPITHNLENYSDMTHYSQDINAYMIDCILNKKDLISPNDPYQSINKLRQQVLDYKVTSF